MNVLIGAVDLVAAVVFLAATIIAAVTSTMTAERTRLWSYLVVAFCVFAIERGTNALEWAMGGQFEALDPFQGYLSTLACLILAGVALSFWWLSRRVAQQQH